MQSAPIRKSVGDGTVSHEMDRYLKPGDGTEPLIELSFYGRGLKNMDFLSKSDPFVVMYRGDQVS